MSYNAGISTGHFPTELEFNPGATVTMFTMHFIIHQIPSKSRNLLGIRIPGQAVVMYGSD